MTDAYTCSVEGLARKTPALVYVFRTWCPACMVTKPIVTQAFK
jgi:thiol-disulfide isomerase/thioredoxin